MVKFSRILRPEAILALEGLSNASHDNWWKELLRLWAPAGSPDGLRLAIRSNYIDFYRMGNRIAHVSFGQSKKGEAAPISVRTHAKYVGGEHAGDNEVKLCENGRGLSWNDRFDFTSFAEISRNIDSRMAEVRKSSPRRGLEKLGVDVILANNPAVIDLEMALSPDPRVPESGDGPPRMDLVALEKHEQEIRIVFWEAKTFDDPRLRFEDVGQVENDRKTTKKKNVLTQLKTYSNYVAYEDRRREIIVAYRETCRLLTWFWSMRGEKTPLHSLIVQAAAESSNLMIDLKPRLIVFSSEGGKDVNSDPFWTRHKDRIVNADYPMIVKNRAAEISLPL